MHRNTKVKMKIYVYLVKENIVHTRLDAIVLDFHQSQVMMNIRRIIAEDVVITKNITDNH